MRFFAPFAALVLLSTACADDVQDIPVADVTVVTETAPPPQVRKDISNLIDDSFSDEAQIEAWRQEVADLAATRPEIDTARFVTYFDALSFDHNSLGAMVSRHDNAVMWGPTADCDAEEELFHIYKAEGKILEDAAVLFASDQEWDASRIYMVGGHTAKARECMMALREEYSWKAAGRLAIELGDFTVLDEAVDAMLLADHTDNIKDLGSYAVRLGHDKTADHMAQKLEWNLSELLTDNVLWEEIECGNTDLLREIVPTQIEREIENGLYWNSIYDTPSQTMLSNIVLLAKSDEALALKYAKVVLEWDHLNVVYFVISSEYNNYAPVVDAEAFWHLIKNDETLVSLYLKRVDAWFERLVSQKDGQELSPEVVYGPMSDWPDVAGPMFDAHQEDPWLQKMQAVGRHGDDRLRKYYMNWVKRVRVEQDFEDMYATIGELRYQISLKLLGEDWDLESDDLSDASRFILAHLSSNQDKAPVPFADDYGYDDHGHHYCYNATLFFRDGSAMCQDTVFAMVSAADLTFDELHELWTALEVETTPYTGQIYTTPEEVETASKVAVASLTSDGLNDKAVQICHGILLGTGHEPCSIRFATYGFGSGDPIFNALALENARQGDLEQAVDILANQMSNKMYGEANTLEQWRLRMSTLLGKPYQVANINARAFRYVEEFQQNEIPTPSRGYDGRMIEMTAMPEVCTVDPVFCGGHLQSVQSVGYCHEHAETLVLAGDTVGAKLLLDACGISD